MPDELQKTRNAGESPIAMGRPGRGHHLAGPIRKPKDVKGAFRRLWGYLARCRTELIAVSIFVAVSTGLGLLGPFLLGKAVDTHILKGDTAGLASTAALMVGIYAAAALTSWLQTYIMAGTAQRVANNLRCDLFAKLQTLPVRFFDQNSHGDLMSRLTNDIDTISATLSQSVPQLIGSVLTVVGTTAMMFLLNWRLALVALFTVPMVTGVSRLIARQTRQSFRQQRQDLGNLNGFIEETISGQQVVKAYCQEENVLERFQTANLQLKNSSIRAQILAGFMGPTMNLLNNISFAAVVAIGGWMVIRGLATVGVMTSFVTYLRQFSRPLNHIASLYNTIQSALAGAERVFAVMDETPEIDAAPPVPTWGNVRGKVIFEDVSFGYAPDKPVLKHVSFAVQPGQCVAIVGPTGAGKTTIVNLLTRFYEPDSGTITIDDRDIRKIPKEELRRRLGIVLQDSCLFSLSVRENIRYGRPGASDEEVEEAARLANAHHFITRLPQGYDTLLSRAGSSLSQGQRQLIAIARAILADPAILILDEATSSVDTRTEKHIQEAMLRLMQGRTSFVIAHRLSTIRKADLILVINNGEIIEKGTHRSLLQQKGFYYTLYTTQYRQETQETEAGSGQDSATAAL